MSGSSGRCSVGRSVTPQVSLPTSAAPFSLTEPRGQLAGLGEHRVVVVAHHGLIAASEVVE